MEEDTTFSDFYRLNLQTIQALKGKSSLKQTHQKCNCNSSSFEETLVIKKFAVSRVDCSLLNKS
jgi:hypothetical protein